MQVKKQQGGFTLIELVVVIVILGILAATALPKFVNIQNDAQTAAVQGVAGAVSSAFAVNYAADLANSTRGSAIIGAAANVTTAAGNIMQGGWPGGYVASPSTVACGTVQGGNSAGTQYTVTISNTAYTQTSQTATATVVCTG